MIKLTFCLHRLPHLTREEFQRYWFEVHAPLVRSHARTLRIERYVQLHATSTPLNEALQVSRGGPAEFDGIAELWWRTLDDLTEVVASPASQEAQAALLEDEKRFIDLARSPLWLSEEKTIVGGPR
jgi:uncharacterized protein (TIGR02118 family)